jgi:ubiquinone/menaquinone biosynthesis C-methylase UbiE
MHVPDAERAFAEMVRVIRRGGRLSVFDFDWETQIIDSPYTQTGRPTFHPPPRKARNFLSWLYPRV